jgi:hypothetical protein
MSNMTVREVLRARAEAEKQISEILTRLMRETGAIDISTSLRCVSAQTVGHADGPVFVESFQIRLEI